MDAETPRTMIFGPTPPGVGSVGELYLAEVVRQFERGRVCCYSAWSKNYAVGIPAPDLDDVATRKRELPNETRYAAQLGRSRFRSNGNHKRQWAALDPLVDDAIAFGRQHKVEVVLSCLASPSTIRMTERVAQGLNARLACLVWDPPESTMKLLNFDQPNTSAVMKDFESCLRSADSIAVASTGMAADVLLRFGKPSVVLTRPIADRMPYREVSDPSHFTIGFCGSTYSTDAFGAFLDALHELEWRVGDKPIAFKILGNAFSLPLNFTGHQANMQFFGHRSLNETVLTLADCDLVYLPYWFDEQFSLSVRNCFPDKLVTYIAAGAPILFHGPRDSSVTRFMERFPVGVCCHTLNKTEVAQTLKAISGNPDTRKHAYAAGTKAQSEELNIGVFRNRLQALLSGSC